MSGRRETSRPIVVHARQPSPHSMSCERRTEPSSALPVTSSSAEEPCVRRGSPGRLVAKHGADRSPRRRPGLARLVEPARTAFPRTEQRTKTVVAAGLEGETGDSLIAAEQAVSHELAAGEARRALAPGSVLRAERGQWSRRQRRSLQRRTSIRIREEWSAAEGVAFYHRETSRVQGAARAAPRRRDCGDPTAGR